MINAWFLENIPAYAGLANRPGPLLEIRGIRDGYQ